MKDVEFIDEDVGEALVLVQKVKQGDTEYRTKIKTILDRSITTISSHALKAFCQKNGIKAVGGGSLRKAPKNLLCDRITLYVEDPEAAATASETSAAPLSKKKASTTPPIVVNNFRLLNVLFGEKIRQRLHERARTLQKDEMTLGKKTGQTFYEAVVDEYNTDHDDGEYDTNAHRDAGVTIADANQPWKYSPNLTAGKAKEVTNGLFREYDRAVARWKLSGNHGELVYRRSTMTVMLNYRGPLKMFRHG